MYISVVVLDMYRVVQPSPLSKQHMFNTPRRNLIPFSSHFPFPIPPSSWQPLIYFLSLWICLFWIFSIYGIIICSPFVSDFFHLAWFIWHLTMLLVCINSLFHLIDEHYFIVWIYHSWFIHSHGEGYWLSLFWAIINKAAINMHYRFWCTHKLLCLLGKHLVVRLMNHMAQIHLTL